MARTKLHDRCGWRGAAAADDDDERLADGDENAASSEA